MENIIYHLNGVNMWLRLKPSATRSLVVGQTESGVWLVADDDLEVSTLVVVRYMLYHNYTSVGDIDLLINGRNYQLVLRKRG